MSLNVGLTPITFAVGFLFFAVNREDALDTAKARNPKARVIGVNPTLRDTI